MEKFVPKRQEKEVISMRIPIELLREIDRQAGMINISRNEFIPGSRRTPPQCWDGTA